jgi:hypothetical protein
LGTLSCMLLRIIRKYERMRRSMTSQSRCSRDVNLRTAGAFGFLYFNKFFKRPIDVIKCLK